MARRGCCAKGVPVGACGDVVGTLTLRRSKKYGEKHLGSKISKISKQLAAGCWSAFGKVDLCCDLGGQWAV